MLWVLLMLMQFLLWLMLIIKRIPVIKNMTTIRNTASGKLIIKEKAAPPEPSYDAGSDGKYSAAVAKLHAEKAYQEEHRVMDKRRKNMFVQTAVVIEDEGIKLEEE